MITAAGALLAPSAPAYGQLHGRVIDGRGQPIPGARVELWGPLKRLGVQVAASSGAFEFPAAQADSATGVIATRVGYMTRTQPVAQSARTLTVVLTETAVQLQPLAVRAAPRRVCPNRDDPEARALWGSAAGRYGSPDTLVIEAHEVYSTAEVPWAEVGLVDERSLRPNQRGTGPQRRAVRPERGYGFRIRESLEPDFAAWNYFELGSHFTQHFIDSSFGTYNSLSVRARLPDATVIAFCSRDLGPEAVKIEGTLMIGRDSTLVSAAWRFRTPRPEEDAGGEVTFVPHPGSGRQPWLVPATSLYWRGITGLRDLYFQRWERFSEWVVAPMNRSRPAATPP